MIGRHFVSLRAPSLRLPTFAENNANYFVLLAALPAATGSLVSVLLVVSDIWAIVCLALGRFRLRFLASDMWVVLPAVLYTAVMAASILVRIDAPRDVGLAMTPAMYLTIPLLVARCRVTPEIDYFDIFLRAAPLCGILLLPVMAWQVAMGEPRISGLAGNPFPFAMICVILGPVSLLNLTRRSRAMALFSLLGFLSCTTGLVASGTRSVWVVLLVNLAILGWGLGRRDVLRRHRVLLVALVAVLAVIAAMFSGRIADRVGTLVYDYHAVADNQVPDVSVATRMGLWTGGIAAAEKRPIFGYGANNRRRVIAGIPIEFPAADGKPNYVGRTHVSHFHNGFLTAMIDAGVFGVLVTLMLLLAPLALAVFSPRDDVYRLRLAFALFLFSTYAITGSVNIMFGQDLIDALFVTGCLVLALSVGTGPRAAREGRVSR